ncbi:hypothetical protein SAMN04487969_13354 [Paenibacillus algorifonticola]|uniref:Butirosin biosynthesis protein H, N-terminal n=1 Tax=Paenibacillus algorifonticola TaxID=684063 RepID=A0A1I2IC28_9BACL|nr:hypothetical protein [Paenibacillus algorifonticola]SFF39845.1 hypothetical protein SAMN04487969_13354 [Paenibacillus algorifonticola]
MTKKMLPITIPIVVGYKRYSHFLAVMSNDSKSHAWILNHFIQLYTDKPFEKDIHWLSFYLGEPLIWRHNNNPWIYTQEIELSLINQLTPLDEFIISCIDSNQYVYINCDYFYVPYSNFYGKVNRRSQLLITGYDLEKNEFTLMDYFNAQYMAVTISIPALVHAAKQGIYGQALNRSKIVVIELNQVEHYEFNLSLASKLLKDYLYARNSYERMPLFTKPREQAAFGIDIYADLQHFLDRIEQQSTPHSSLPFHILYEHKKCMRLLFDYLIKMGSIEPSAALAEEFSLLVEKTLVLRNLYFKLEISEDLLLIGKMKQGVETIKALEISALEKLIGLIDGVGTDDLKQEALDEASSVHS